MDAALIEQKVYAGYGKAAIRVGYLHQIWRPTSAVNPTTTGDNRGAVNAAFTVAASSFNFNKAGAYKDVFWNGLYDGSQTQVGDYLISEFDGSTYYVAAQQALLPILCVKCNRVVNVYQPGPNAPGSGYEVNPGYGGTVGSGVGNNETPIMTSWPASIMFDARGRATEVGLPTDLPSPFFQILLPDWPGLDVRSGCFIGDDQTRRYTIAASEKSPLGWRLSAQQAVT